QDALDVFPYITGFGEYRGVYDGKRDIQQPGDRFREQGFTRTGLAYHNDVTLLDLDLVLHHLLLQTLIVIIDGHRQYLFGIVLTDNIFIQYPFDLNGLFYRQFERAAARRIIPDHQLLLNDLLRMLDTVLANMPFLTRDEDLYLVAVPTTKRTVQCIFCHNYKVNKIVPMLTVA